MAVRKKICIVCLKELPRSTIRRRLNSDFTKRSSQAHIIRQNYTIERRAIFLVLPTFWQAVISITKYTIIPNPNPNPNTKMTVNTIPWQIWYCNIVILCILIVVFGTWSNSPDSRKLHLPLGVSTLHGIFRYSYFQECTDHFMSEQFQFPLFLFITFLFYHYLFCLRNIHNYGSQREILLLSVC